MGDSEWSVPGDTGSLRILNPIKYKWNMDFFGDGKINIQFINNVPFIHRLVCKKIFKSKWTKL